MAEELKAETNRILKCVLHPKPNIIKGDAKAFKELRQDTAYYSWLTKGSYDSARQGGLYLQSQVLLAPRNIFRALTADLTNKHKKKLIIMLRTIKAEGGLGDIKYKRLYPTGAGQQNIFYVQPKVTKRTSLLGP